MTASAEANKQVNPSPAGSQTADLSNAIRQSVGKLPGEEVRCTRVWGDRYRCNWWAPMEGDGVTSVSRRIVRSKFLKVTTAGDGLLIEDLTR